MTVRDAFIVVPLVLGVGAVGLCAVGLLAVRGVYDRLHLVGALTLAGAPAVALALVVASGPTSTVAGRGVLVAVLLLITNPVLGHVIARAERLRACGNLDVRPEDGADAP